MGRGTVRWTIRIYAFTSTRRVPYLVRWECTVIEYQIYHIDPFWLKFFDFVRWFADSHHFLYIVLFQFLWTRHIVTLKLVESENASRRRELYPRTVAVRLWLTWIKVWMVWSLGRSVMRNFMFLNAISAGAGLISFTLMLLISFLTADGCIIYLSPLIVFNS